jgi:hypothetical protein
MLFVSRSLNYGSLGTLIGRKLINVVESSGIRNYFPILVSNNSVGWVSIIIIWKMELLLTVQLTPTSMDLVTACGMKKLSEAMKIRQIALDQPLKLAVTLLQESNKLD